jgi:hypothetical protein
MAAACAQEQPDAGNNEGRRRQFVPPALTSAEKKARRWGAVARRAQGYGRSTMTAMPSPPPMQSEATPRRFPRSFMA